MIALSNPEIAAIDGDAQRIGVFFRLDVEPKPIRLWAGVGPCQVGINAFDTAGAVYNGFGEMANVPAFQSLLNGVAERLTFRLSGTAVTRRVVNSAAQEAQTVRGAQVLLGICIFDAAWQQLGAIKWLFRGRGDYVSVTDQESGDNSGGRDYQIELSVGSLLTGRRRRGLSYLTDADQQARHPGDKFCERTALYANETVKVWPKLTS